VAWETPGHRCVTRGKIQDKNRTDHDKQEIDFETKHFGGTQHNSQHTQHTQHTQGKKSSTSSSVTQHKTSHHLKLPKPLSKAFKKLKARSKDNSYSSTAYGSSIDSDSNSSENNSRRSSTDFETSNESLHFDFEIENQLYFRRLFKAIELHGGTCQSPTPSSTSSSTSSSACQVDFSDPRVRNLLVSEVLHINSSRWQAFRFCRNIFIELGQSALRDISKHDLIDMIDHFNQEFEVDRLVFYYHQNRSDVRNLNATFRVMDFTPIVGNQVFEGQFQLEADRLGNFVVNEFNNYWTYDVAKGPVGFGGSDSEVFDSEDDIEEDFF